MWIRNEGAFEGIAPIDTFMKAQEILTERSRKFSDEELLEHLKRLYKEAGTLSGFIIDQAPDMPSSHTYIYRFGSLSSAYEKVGIQSPRNLESLEINKRLRRMHPEIIERTKNSIAEIGGQV